MEKETKKEDDYKEKFDPLMFKGMEEGCKKYTIMIENIKKKSK